jgi:asparagine synthase (glutamine-hydrolysing)
MSAIFGYCSFDDQPESVIEEHLNTMMSELSMWAPDGFKTNITQSAGFGIAVQSLRDVDTYLSSPTYLADQSLLFAASARLDNRSELLHGSASNGQTKHDADLILEQYLKHGEDTFHTLMGDWAFAAFDSRKKQLNLVRDHIGHTALYYTVNRSFIAFAPTPHALLVLNGVSNELDEWNLACSMTRFPHPETADHTKWKEIRQLLPSHQLKADPENFSVDRYWSFEEASPVRLNSDEEYYEQFRELMSQAVQSRMSGYDKIATTLSSGFDSGTVTAFAAKILAEENKTLSAYTSVPLYKNVHGMRESIVDEWPIAHSHTRNYPNIKHIPVDGQKSAPHRVLKKIVNEYGETVLTTGNAFWIEEILQKARKDGNQVLLTGQMGNGGISWYGSRNQILYKFIEGQWISGIKSVHQFKQNYGISWYKVVRYLFLWQLLSPIKKLYQEIILQQEPDWITTSPINPAFAERMNLKATVRSSSLTGYKHTLQSPTHSRVQMMDINAPITCATWHRNSVVHKLDIHDPTADMRVLKFCFGIPDELHANRGETRLLIKNALKEIVPDEVLNYKYKGRQAADISLRLLDYKEELKSEIDAISTNPVAREFLDIPSLYESLQNLSPDLTYTKSFQYSSCLLTGLMYGYFFKKYG